MGRRPKTPPLVEVPTGTPALVAAIDATVAALMVLRQQLVVATNPSKDEWVSQRESPLPSRVHARLCRAMLQRGDARAAVRSRTHYLRQSAIDECLVGAPKRRAPAPISENLSAGEKFRRELVALGAIPDDPV